VSPLNAVENSVISLSIRYLCSRGARKLYRVNTLHMYIKPRYNEGIMNHSSMP
jgi:hypothetical protein